MIEIMTIQEALNYPEPKHVAFDGDVAIVYTEVDMPTTEQYPLIILDPAQFRKALLHGGDVLGIDLKTSVETALQHPSKKQLQIDYEYKPSFHSNDQRIIDMAIEMGLTKAWLYENIFVYGQTLN